MYTGVLLTMDRAPKHDAGLVGDVYSTGKIIGAEEVKGMTKKGGEVLEHQRVVSCGSSVREVKPGDVVAVNLMNFSVQKYRSNGFNEGVENMKNEVIEFRYPTVNIDGTDYLFCDERDIAYIVEDYEEVDE